MLHSKRVAQSYCGGILHASCDMKAIQALETCDITLIEDAAHALGGQYLGEPVGNCQYSDMAVLSFHPVKAITSAEIGAITTNNELANSVGYQ